jgi:hypothetical protein
MNCSMSQGALVPACLPTTRVARVSSGTWTTEHEENTLPACNDGALRAALQGGKGAQDPQLLKQSERLGTKMTAPKSFPRRAQLFLEALHARCSPAGLWMAAACLST